MSKSLLSLDVLNNYEQVALNDNKVINSDVRGIEAQDIQPFL